MSRILLDDDLLEWEAYASAGDAGLPLRAHIVFDCLSDRSRAPRYVAIEGDKADAERLVLSIAPEELRALLRRAEELD